MSKWTLFSNHGHVMVCLSRDPKARLRDVAADVGITERAVQKIVRDLQDADMLSVKKTGRRNHYRINQKQTLRHSLEDKCTLKALLKVVNKAQDLETENTNISKVDENPAADRFNPSPNKKTSLKKTVTGAAGSGEEAEKDSQKTDQSKAPEARREQKPAGDEPSGKSRRKKKDKPDIATKPETPQGSLF